MDRASHDRPPPRHGNWSPDRRVEKAELRRQFRETTPGQRVEEAAILSRELTLLAARHSKRG